MPFYSSSTISGCPVADQSPLGHRNAATKPGQIMSCCKLQQRSMGKLKGIQLRLNTINSKKVVCQGKGEAHGIYYLWEVPESARQSLIRTDLSSRFRQEYRVGLFPELAFVFSVCCPSKIQSSCESRRLKDRTGSMLLCYMQRPVPTLAPWYLHIDEHPFVFQTLQRCKSAQDQWQLA